MIEINQVEKQVEDVIEIIPYDVKYKQYFRSLNIEWISKFFKMEDEDFRLLDNPEQHILDKGGYIVFGLLNNQVVGTCAIVKCDHEDNVYELIKMGVSPLAQGKQIGYKIGQSLIIKAKELNATKLSLETHSSLIPAIKLYEKLGFKHIPLKSSLYSRADTKMELIL